MSLLTNIGVSGVSIVGGLCSAAWMRLTCKCSFDLIIMMVMILN